MVGAEFGLSPGHTANTQGMVLDQGLLMSSACPQRQTQLECSLETQAVVSSCPQSHPGKFPCPWRAMGGAVLPKLQPPRDIQDMSFQMGVRMTTTSGKKQAIFLNLKIGKVHIT